MQFLKDFHVLYDSVPRARLQYLRWRIEPSVLDELRRMANGQGKPLEASTRILGLPYVEGTTRSGTIDLIWRDRPRSKASSTKTRSKSPGRSAR